MNKITVWILVACAIAFITWTVMWATMMQPVNCWTQYTTEVQAIEHCEHHG